MKADPAAQRRLLDLAEIDTALARVDHRRRTLPELAEIAKAEETARTRRDATVAVRTTLDDLDREVRRQEKEIEAVRARADKDATLLRAGSVGAKQLTDLEHELASLRRRQSALEDDLLELMERREAVELDGKHAELELAKAEQALADAARRRDEALADLDTEQARRGATRDSLRGELPDPLLAIYDRVRAAKGAGASLLHARRCGVCRLELDRTTLARIREAAADEVVRCEECGAILVRATASPAGSA